ncbi:MAG: histidine phosphatase family protein [Parcubacteria group bacterium]|nr:histidine phosphatase family protein [Parcubacteria group bacterium]
MKNVYFVRHGETGSNRDRTHQGPNEPLTDLGRKQAEIVADRLTRIPFDVIVASDLKRAHETSMAISKKTGKEVVESPLFRERKIVTELIGLPHKSLEAEQIRSKVRARYDDPLWHYSDEENFFDLRGRAKEAIAFLEHYPQDNIVVVTHGMFLTTLIGVLIEPDMTPTFWQHIHNFLVTTNTGITWCQKGHPHSEKPDTWQLISWNDHAHLG